jgi:hypothetical protein
LRPTAAQICPARGVHEVEVRDALRLAGSRVDDLHPGRERALVDAEEREIAVLVADRLEHERDRRLLLVGLDRERLVGLRIDGLDLRLVERRRQERPHAVEQALDALVAQRRSAEHRRDLPVDRGLADAADQVLERDLVARQELLAEVVAGLGQLLFEEGALLGGHLGVLGRDLVEDEAGALRLVVVFDRLHLHEVDHADEVLLGAHRDEHGDRVRSEALLDRLHGLEVVGADPVHLVDERDARDVVLVGLAPDGLGLGLDPGDRAEDADGAIEDAERALHLGREVDVAGGVDQVDRDVAPVARRGGALDGDPALLLFRQVVHRRGAFVHLAHPVFLSGVEEHAFRDGGLPGIDMGHDADVPDPGNLVGLHGLSRPCWRRASACLPSRASMRESRILRAQVRTG